MPAGDTGERGRAAVESVEQPAKVMRIGSMVKQLLDEVRSAPLDEASRARLREIYEHSIRELAEGSRPTWPPSSTAWRCPSTRTLPSEAELRIAQAQLVGWLEGLFHGIQATLMAQQMAARAQLEEMRQRGLPAGRRRPPDAGYLPLSEAPPRHPARGGVVSDPAPSPGEAAGPPRFPGNAPPPPPAIAPGSPAWPATSGGGQEDAPPPYASWAIRLGWLA